MDHAGYDLLAGAALAGDEDVNRQRPHLLGHVHHPTHNLADGDKLMFLLKLLPGFGDLFMHAAGYTYHLIGNRVVLQREGEELDHLADQKLILFVEPGSFFLVQHLHRADVVGPNEALDGNTDQIAGGERGVLIGFGVKTLLLVEVTADEGLTAGDGAPDDTALFGSDDLLLLEAGAEFQPDIFRVGIGNEDTAPLRTQEAGEYFDEKHNQLLGITPGPGPVDPVQEGFQTDQPLLHVFGLVH